MQYFSLRFTFSPVSRQKLDSDSPEWLPLYLQNIAQPLDAAFFRTQLDAGCLLLLDGIDEVPGQIARKAMARLLERTARMFPKTHIVAASRRSEEHTSE